MEENVSLLTQIHQVFGESEVDLRTYSPLTFAYIGDAEVGEDVNVGCGVVFANYDGKKKQKSRIGNDVFIGCNVNIIAPVNIADKTYICAGTTVTKDTEEGDFVIGRVRQENKKR